MMQIIVLRLPACLDLGRRKLRQAAEAALGGQHCVLNATTASKDTSSSAASDSAAATSGQRFLSLQERLLLLLALQEWALGGGAVRLGENLSDPDD